LGAFLQNKRKFMATQEVSLYCEKCAMFTAHKTILKHRESRQEIFEIEKGVLPFASTVSVPVEDVFSIVKCKNCDTVSGRSVYLMDGELHSESQLLPNSSRSLPNWSEKLPNDIYSTLVEVYNALRSKSYRLAVIGCRTLVDMVSNSKVGDIGGFEAKIKELHKQGILSESTKFVLSHAVNAGNASAHRGWQPTPDESNLVLDIVEHFLQLDVLIVSANNLEKSVPKKLPHRK
jgi:hypothetical protein